jgi:hypothetical protein
MVVNGQAIGRACEEAKHAGARRRQARFCVDCGVQVMVV